MDNESNYKYNYKDSQLDEQGDNNQEDLNKKCASRKQMRKIYHYIQKKLQCLWH